MVAEFKYLKYSISMSFRHKNSIFNDKSVKSNLLLLNICDGLVVPVFWNTETPVFASFSSSNIINLIGIEFKKKLEYKYQFE